MTTAHTSLPSLIAAYEGHVHTHGEEHAQAHSLGVRVTVHGQFLRKRKLSKGLIFGDIALENNALLELMIRAHGDLLTVEQVRQINWDVHIGDMVTITGYFSRKGEGHWILYVLEVTVNEAWSVSHPGEHFDHTQFGNIIVYEPGIYTNPTPSTEQVGSTIPDSVASIGVGLGSVTLAPNSQSDADQKYTNIVQINGFNACKFYFAGGSFGANCLRGQQCHFWHGDPNDYEANRKLWLAKRKEQRRAVGKIDGDHHDPREKLLKDNRARILCDWLVGHLGEERLKNGTGVIDVAGGKGEIPIQLWNLRGIPTTMVEPRPMKLSKKNHKIVQANTNGRGKCPQIQCFLNDETWLEHEALFANCSLIVGMHPDEATEIIVDIALKHRKPFAVVPCCVMSRVFPHRTCQDGQLVENYDLFVRYLMEKDARIQRAFLPFEGKNQVLYVLQYEG